jgi:pimeloyl-ACP methyl ester carboxylesterase
MSTQAPLPSHRGGTGEPLLLIHGFSGTWRVWEPILPYLEPSYDVLAPTLGGHVGGPTVATAELSVAKLGDLLEQTMDDAGFETAHIAGNSLGGWLALELAHRGRARSVVALAPAGGWEPKTRAERRLKGLFTRNYRMSKAMGSRFDGLLARPRFRRLIFGQAMARGDLLTHELAVAMLRDSVDCPAYFDLMEAILRDGPPSTFDGISCPALIAWGTRDRIIPLKRYSQRMRDLVPAAEWLEYPKLGHVPMCDDPGLVADTIREVAQLAHAGRETVPAV